MKPLVCDRNQYKNKLERRYADYLYTLQLSEEIISYKYEPFGLKLAKGTYYHPDFLVIYSSHFEIHETKGFLRDDANVKIKLAARLFPWFLFKMIFWRKGRWEIKDIEG